MHQKYNLKFLCKNKIFGTSIIKHIYWILGIKHKSSSHYSSGGQMQQMRCDVDQKLHEGNEWFLVSVQFPASSAAVSTIHSVLDTQILIWRLPNLLGISGVTRYFLDT